MVDKDFIALLLVVIIAGTGIAIFKGKTSENELETVRDFEIQLRKITENGVQILTIDSCEYVWVAKSNKSGLSHKTNCSFCKQRNSK